MEAGKLCDGKKSTSEVAKLLTRQLSAPVDESVVRLALEELSKARLLVEVEKPVRRKSRREAIRALGIAGAIALPLVTSLVAPTPARCVLPGEWEAMRQQCAMLFGPLWRKFRPLRGLSLAASHRALVVRFNTPSNLVWQTSQTAVTKEADAGGPQPVP